MANSHGLFGSPPAPLPALVLHPLFTDKFYSTAEMPPFDLTVPFPIPTSPDEMPRFLAGEIDSNPFKQKCKEIIENIRTYINENMNSNAAELAELNNKLDECIRLRLTLADSTKSSYDDNYNYKAFLFYNSGIPKLFHIVKFLQSGDYPKDKCNAIIKELVLDIDVCPEGSDNNIDDAFEAFIGNNHVVAKLKNIRYVLLQQRILELLANLHAELPIEGLEGNENHYIPATLNPLANSLGVNIKRDLAIRGCCIRIVVTTIRQELASDLYQTLSPERLASALIMELAEVIESLPETFPQDRASKLKEKLKFYGTEGDKEFLNIHDLVTCDDNDNYALDWKAYDIICSSIFQRLRFSGRMYDNSICIAINDQTDLHSNSHPTSLATNYVHVKNSPDRRFYQPFLTYCVETFLTRHGDELIEFIRLNTEINSKRLEIAAAIIKYLTWQHHDHLQLADVDRLIQCIVNLRCDWRIIIPQLPLALARIFVKKMTLNALVARATTKDDIAILISTLDYSELRQLLLTGLTNRTFNGANAIWFATFYQIHDVVYELLDRGADVNSYNQDGGRSLLHMAVHQNDIRLLGELIVRGANIVINSDTVFTPLEDAMRLQHMECVLILLQAYHDQTNPDAYSKPLIGEEPFLYYVARNNMINLLVETIRIFNPDFHELTSAFFSSIHNNKPTNEMIDWLIHFLSSHLIANPLLINDRALRSSLSTAASEGSIYAIQQLLRLVGCNINHYDEGGWTILHYAAYHDRIESVDYLLVNGADPTLTILPTSRHKPGKSALDLAIDNNPTSDVAGLIRRYIEARNLVRQLDMPSPGASDKKRPRPS